MPVPTIELDIAGMTCHACETRVGKALSAVPGVERARVSARRGRAVVDTTGAVDRTLLARAVRAAGYELGAAERSWVTRDRRVWRDVLPGVAAVAALAVTASALGLLDVVAGAGGRVGTGGPAVALVLGVAAGFSTCMALVGGIVLAVSARFAAAHPGLGARQRVRPHLAFNAGRVVGFGALGAGTGALGSTISLDPRVTAALMIGVSVVMGMVGLRLTELSPRLSTGGLTLPAAVSRTLGLDRARDTYRDRTAALLGAGSFFLPCGFTQAVQVYALSTGSPAQAGLVMALFALGTTPGLLALGGATAAIRGPRADRLLRLAGVVVLAFAAVNLHGALGVLAPGLVSAATPSARPGAPTDNVSFDGDVQVLRTTQVATGYEPATAAVYADREVRWVIDSRALGCATSISVPQLGISRMLDLGENVITFTPTQVGTIAYTCAMGMFGGTIEVLPAPEA